jgi:hypothetical protein
MFRSPIPGLLGNIQKCHCLRILNRKGNLVLWRRNSHFAFGSQVGILLFSWRYQLRSFIFKCIPQKWINCNQNHCIRLRKKFSFVSKNTFKGLLFMNTDFWWTNSWIRSRNTFRPNLSDANEAHIHSFIHPPTHADAQDTQTQMLHRKNTFLTKGLKTCSCLEVDYFTITVLSHIRYVHEERKKNMCVF